MGILSTGFVTLVDLTDQRPVQFYLEINGSRVQSKGGDGTYQPDFTKTPITVYPKLFFGNDNESERITQDIISYTINNVTVSASNTIGYKNDRNCIINKNIPSTNRTQLIEATLTTTNLKDPKTGVSINGGEPLKASIELVLNTSGATIKNITQYYAVNNSKTDTPSGNDWKTDYKQTAGLSPTNKYLWSYTETTYDDDSKAPISTPPAIIGVYGDSGTGILEIKEQYCVSDTDKTQPDEQTGAWVDKAPSYEKDKYIWTRTKITYSDGNVRYTGYKVDSTSDLNKELLGLIQGLQGQIDATIETWYGTETPTLNNEPAVNWNTDELKIRHNGDLYYDTEAGKCYRFIVTETEAKWTEVNDTEIAKLMQEIGKKATIFYEQPIAPYEVGDLWVTNNGTIKKCIKSKPASGSFAEGDWEVHNDKTPVRYDVQYITTSSPSDKPNKDANWETTAKPWKEGEYLWSRTLITYADGSTNKDSAVPTCITASTRSIKEVKNYYKASPLNGSSGKKETRPSADPTDDTGVWKITPSAAVLNSTNKYLWNYEKTVYTYGNPTYTEPKIIGNYASDGKGVKTVTEAYAINNSATVAPSFNKDTNILTSGHENAKANTWYTVAPSTTDDNRYLWNAEKIVYTIGEPGVINPRVIGYRGVTVEEITVYYRLNNTNTLPNDKIPTKTDSAEDLANKGWTTNKLTVDSRNKFLFSFTLIKYTDGKVDLSTPVVIGNYSKDGANAASLEVYANRLAFDKQNNGDITITADFRVGGKIQNTGVTYRWTRVPSKDSFNSTGKTVKVKRDDVDGLTTFTCTVSYTGYDNFSDSVTINDYTDPIVSEIVSSNGTQFKNSNIETDLTCRLFDSDGEVDPYVDGKAMEEYIYGYIWLKSANNTIVSNPWRSVTYPCICKDANGNYSIANNEAEASGKEKFVSGKKISINKTDIESKATFYCEVIKL